MIRFRYLDSKENLLIFKDKKEERKTTDIEARGSSDYYEFRRNLMMTRAIFRTHMNRIMERGTLPEKLNSSIIYEKSALYIEYEYFVHILEVLQNYLKEEKERFIHDTSSLNRLLRTLIVIDNKKLYLFTSDILIDKLIKAEVEKCNYIDFVDTGKYTYEDYINASRDERVHQWIR